MTSQLEGFPATGSAAPAGSASASASGSDSDPSPGSLDLPEAADWYTKEGLLHVVLSTGSCGVLGSTEGGATGSASATTTASGAVGTGTTGTLPPVLVAEPALAEPESSLSHQCRCSTAFHIGGGWFLTASHMLRSIGDVMNARYYYGEDRDAFVSAGRAFILDAQVDHTRHDVGDHPPLGFESPDIVAVHIPDLVGCEIKYAPLASLSAPSDSGVYVPWIQPHAVSDSESDHSSSESLPMALARPRLVRSYGIVKGMSPTDGAELEVPVSFLSHTAPAKMGSSGAPVCLQPVLSEDPASASGRQLERHLLGVQFAGLVACLFPLLPLSALWNTPAISRLNLNFERWQASRALQLQVPRPATR
jgi:hypothetical protein